MPGEGPGAQRGIDCLSEGGAIERLLAGTLMGKVVA